MATGTAQAGEDRLLTLPNAFTAIRLLCIPLFVWLLLGRHPHDRWHAAVLLAAIGATDWVDGYLARHLHQVSTLGKVLDPTADRLLLGVAVVAILIDGSVPLGIGLIVIVREALVAGAVVALAAAGASRIDVQWVGKAGTLGLMVTFPLFLAGHSTLGLAPLAEAVAWCVAVPSLMLSLYAAVTYVPLARRALEEGRKARSGGARSAGTRPGAARPAGTDPDGATPEVSRPPAATGESRQ
jgi:cardiolipin synthase